MLKKVVLKGPILTNSGYGVHCRQVFKSLLKRKNIDLYVQPTVWGNTSWILDSNFDDGIVQKVMHFTNKQSNNKFDESYQVILPSEWKKIAKKNIGITAGFEADIVKKDWIDCCNRMDSVIVPSLYAKSAFLNTVKRSNAKLKTKITVINEWYYEEFDKEKEGIELDFLKDHEFDKNILIFGQISNDNAISDRKNIVKTINTALEFVKDKDIGIILKINAGRYNKKHIDMISRMIADMFSDRSNGNIFIIDNSLSVDQLEALYRSNKISCILSGVRAEGWGLTLLEAAACGLPIVATNYSSYLEFLQDDFLKVDYDLKHIGFYDPNFIDENKKPKWAEFKEESMLSCLEELFSNYSKFKEIALSRQNIIKQEYSKNNIIKEYGRFFEKLK